MEETHLSKLEPELHEQALAAFHKLANDQRGEPEAMGGGGRGNPDIWNATGIWTYLSEHVGDISNRISNRNHVSMAYGISMAEPKVISGLRTLRHGYGVAREIEENIRSARRYHEEKTGETVDPDKWRNDWVAATKRYAEAHKKLVVYNEAQFCAREAAVQIGKRDYVMAEVYLARLAKMMDSDDWLTYGGTVYVSNGQIVPYTPRVKQTISEGVIRLGGRSKDPDSPTEKFMVEYREGTISHAMLPGQIRLLSFSAEDFVMLDVRPSFDSDNEVHLSDINTNVGRGKGLGSKALKWLCDLADKHGVVIEGDSKAYMAGTPGTLKQKDLSAWYTRYGFKVARDGAMERQPHQ